MTTLTRAGGLEAHLAERLVARVRAMDTSDVVVWGASTSGARVCEVLDREAIAFRIVDSDARRHVVRSGAPAVLDPSTLVAHPPRLVVIASTSPEATAAIRSRVATSWPAATVVALVDLVASEPLPSDVVHLALDRPREEQPVRRWLALQGWAAAAEGITHVEAVVEGRRARLAHGLPRPDVAAVLASTPGAGLAGFADVIDCSTLPEGPHQVEVTAWSGAGVVARVHRTVHKVAHADPTAATCPFCGASMTPTGRVVNDFLVMGCRACGGASVVPPPDEASCREWYNDADVYGMIARARRQAEESPVHPDADFVATTLRSHLHRDRVRVLEVGCANGRLLNGLRQHGFEVAGVEISMETSRVAREVFGLDVRTGLLAEHDFGGPFDAVVSRHVIEHLPDPGAELARIRERLRKRGLLILVTPNFASLASRMLRERWEWFIPPLHAQYFTSQALAALSRRAGFRVVSVGTRRGDARPLDEELGRWVVPLARAGQLSRSLAYKVARPLVRRLAASSPILSSTLWHEELVMVLEAR